MANCKRVSVLLLLGLVAPVFNACSEAPPPSSAGPPNIIFIMSDDHAYQAISAYGSRINRTPQIDRLADEGMLFRRAYVTNSICAPSRAVILTGKHSHLNGVLDNRLEFDGSQQTFPKILREAGYQTAIVGKWHLKSEPTGFDYWQVLPGQGSYYNPDFRTPGGTVRIDGYVTDIITDLALNWLESGRDPEKPFMLIYQHKAPHRAWWPGPDHLTDFADKDLPEPETLFDDYSNRGTAAKDQAMTILHHMLPSADLKLKPDQVEKHSITGTAERDRTSYERHVARFTESQRRQWDEVYDVRNQKFFEQVPEDSRELLRQKYQFYIKDYLRCIASVDNNVGRLLDYLDENGLSENTLVVYTSDQGFYLGEHGWFDKRFMYEESFRTPLLVRWPGVISAGSESDLLVQNLDFAQTFLEAAGLEIPEDMQGLSLLPILRGTVPENWRDSLYYHYYEYPGAHSVKRHYGVFDGRYKLIHFYHDVDEWEFYDLEEDPSEMKNVIDEERYAQEVVRLRARLAELREFYADSTPEAEDDD